MKSIVEALIKRAPSFEQKSQTWLDYRKQFVTASSASDIVYKTENLITAYNKISTIPESIDPDENCNPFDSKQDWLDKKLGKRPFTGNVATRFGERFEPVSADYYRLQTNQILYECSILNSLNPDTAFLAASPDGITENGVMLEIKSPYSRKYIKGFIPLRYYIQILLQLYVCGLQECDYLECFFKEYYDIVDFFHDKKKNPLMSGCIVEKIGQQSTAYSYYSPKTFDNEECNEFILKETQQSDVMFKIIWWHLEQANQIRIPFDQSAFNDMLPSLKSTFEEYQQLLK